MSREVLHDVFGVELGALRAKPEELSQPFGKREVVECVRALQGHRANRTMELWRRVTEHWLPAFWSLRSPTACRPPPGGPGQMLVEFQCSVNPQTREAAALTV